MLVLAYLLLFLAVCAALTCCRIASYNRNFRLAPHRAQRSVPSRDQR